MVVDESDLVEGAQYLDKQDQEIDWEARLYD